MSRMSLILSIILLLSVPMSGCINQKNDTIVTIDSDDDGDCVFNLVEQELGTDTLSNDSDNDSYLDTYDRFPTDSARYKLDNESFIRSSCYYDEDADFYYESNDSRLGSTEEVRGKIQIITAWISNNQTLNSSIDLVWELAPGSEKVWEDEIVWQITCDNNGSERNVSGNFVGTMDLQGDAGLENLSNQADPGLLYMTNLKTSSEDSAECPIKLNEEMTLWIHINGGGSTYETPFINNASIGSSII